MDPLLIALQELQKEKQCLRQKLTTDQRKNKCIEQEVEKADMQVSKNREKHTKMAEILARAKQKVEQAIAERKRYERETDIIRVRVQDYQSGFDNGKTTQEQNLEAFGVEISAISDELFQARRTYNPKSLENEKEKVITMDKNLHSKIVTDQKQRKIIKQTIEKFQESKDSDYGIPQTCLVIISALERDGNDIQLYLNRVRSELEDVHEALRFTQLSVEE